MEGSAAIKLDNTTISQQIVREIPNISVGDDKEGCKTYDPISSTRLLLHAQDKDEARTGWAAVAPDVSEKRLKAILLDPLTPDDLWGKDIIIADVVIVSAFTAQGYVPDEIQISRILDNDQALTVETDNDDT